MNQIKDAADRQNMISYLIEGTDYLKTIQNDVETIYPLRKTTDKEILKRRIEKIPTFVLKCGDDLYLTDIDGMERLSFYLKPKEHQCPNCIRCRATLEQLGGCSKVRDCSTRVYLLHRNSWRQSVLLSKRIEKYPFIQYGYETFGINVVDEILSVEECQHFCSIKVDEKRRKIQKEIESHLFQENVKLKNAIF